MRRCSVFRPRIARNAVERPRDRADRVLQERHLLGELRVVADDDDAADHVGMAVEVLRRRMHDEVARRIRAAAAASASRTCCRPTRIRPCLRANAPSLARSTSFSIGLVGVSAQIIRVFGFSAAFTALASVEVDETEIEPRAAPAHALEQAVAAAVEIVHRDDVAAAVEQVEHRRRRRHARRERETARCRLRDRPRSARTPCASGSACASIRSPCARRGFSARRSRSRRSAP